MKNLQVTLEQAKELLITMPNLKEAIYNAYPELKPKPTVPTWEEAFDGNGYYIDADSNINKL